MCVFVSSGLNNTHPAVAVNAQESVRGVGGDNRIHRNLDGVTRAPGTILEADWHTEPAGQLAMRLAFYRASTYRSPRYDIRQVLGSYRVEPFDPGWQADVQHIQQKLTRPHEPGRDVERSV